MFGETLTSQNIIIIIFEKTDERNTLGSRKIPQNPHFLVRAPNIRFAPIRKELHDGFWTL